MAKMNDSILPDEDCDSFDSDYECEEEEEECEDSDETEESDGGANLFAEFDDEAGFDEKVHFSPVNMYTPQTRRYMEVSLMSPQGANLTYLRLVLGSHENRRIQNTERCVEIVSVHPFVLGPRVNYPYRLFRVPLLETFVMSYVLNVKSWKLFRNYLKDHLDLAALMPIVTPGHSLYQQRNTQSWRDELTVQSKEHGEGLFEFFNLWLSGIDMKISINKIKLLVIHHRRGFLMLNRLKKNIVEMILLGLSAGTPVKHVHLDNVEVDDLNMIPTDHLERLVLYRVKTKSSVAEFLRKCRKLRLFYCMDMNGELVDFSNDLHFGSPGGPEIIALGLGNARLTCSNMPLAPIAGSFIKLLELYNCQCDSSFFHAIPNLFPRLKQLKFFGIMTLKLLYNFLLIDTILCFYLWKLETVPQLVARSDPSVREVKQESVHIVKNLTFKKNIEQIIVNVLKDEVLKTFPWKNSSGKIFDQTWSYDFHASEEPRVTQATKKFLLASSICVENEYIDFNEPICEAFILRRYGKCDAEMESMKYNFLLRELNSEPCCSKEVVDFLSKETTEWRWRSTPIRCRNEAFPFQLAREFGWIYPYSTVDLFCELEEFPKLRDVDRMDRILKNSLDHFSEIHLLD